MGEARGALQGGVPDHHGGDRPPGAVHARAGVRLDDLQVGPHPLLRAVLQQQARQHHARAAHPIQEHGRPPSGGVSAATSTLSTAPSQPMQTSGTTRQSAPSASESSAPTGSRARDLAVRQPPGPPRGCPPRSDLVEARHDGAALRSRPSQGTSSRPRRIQPDRRVAAPHHVVEGAPLARDPARVLDEADQLGPAQAWGVSAPVAADVRERCRRGRRPRRQARSGRSERRAWASRP